MLKHRIPEEEWRIVTYIDKCPIKKPHGKSEYQSSHGKAQERLWQICKRNAKENPPRAPILEDAWGRSFSRCQPRKSSYLDPHRVQNTHQMPSDSTMVYPYLRYLPSERRPDNTQINGLIRDNSDLLRKKLDSNSDAYFILPYGDGNVQILIQGSLTAK